MGQNVSRIASCVLAAPGTWYLGVSSILIAAVENTVACNLAT